MPNNFIFKGKGAINKPSPDLYNLDGNIQIEMRDDNSSNNHKFVVPISAKQLLLKGAVLKNTKWIIGIVCYTGHKTKLLLNSKKINQIGWYPKIRLSVGLKTKSPTNSSN